MNPTEHPELWDKYRLAARPSPGVVTLSGLEREDKWDVKEAEGQDGASATRKGAKLIQFSASHYLVYDPTDGGPDEFEEWNDFLPLLKSTTAEGDAKALEFYHPDAAQLDLSAVVVVKIGALQHDGKGGATVKVDYLEYAPPKAKSASTPSGAKAGSAKAGAGNFDSSNDPNEQAKRELDELVEEWKKP